MKRTAIAIAVGALSAGLAHGTFAQDEDVQQQNDSAQEQPEVHIEEGAADVNVDQQPAEVQVDQQPPDVTVEQQDPNVNVEQAEPNVTVESSGEADVNVEHAEEAEAELRNPDEQNEQQDQAAQDQAAQSGDLTGLQVSEIEGYSVFSQEDDEEIGNVDRVVQDTQTNEAYVVIAEGGFLGFGADEIGYSVDELQIRNEDELVVHSTDSGQSHDFSSDQYEDVDGDRTLGEIAQ